MYLFALNIAHHTPHYITTIGDYLFMTEYHNKCL